MKELFEKFKNLLPKKTENHVKTAELEPPPPELSEKEKKEKILKPFFNSFTIPVPSHVYRAYGRPPKELDKHLEYESALLVTAKNLPGKWNSGSKKLYVHNKMEPFLREALSRCEQLGVLDYIEKMGSYNHRRIRHDPDAPLSYHSWAIAVDINSSDNFPKYNTKKTPVPPPFSKGWLELYSKGMPIELVQAFTSVGFCWGGDWGKDTWTLVVDREGVGYDENDFSNLVEDWKKVNYVDPMHFELVTR